jgi:hypothetical protein
MRRSHVLLSSLAASFVLVGTARAQALPPEKQTHLGVVAGGSFAKFHGADIGDANKTKVGVAGGIFATIGIVKNFAIEPQVLFAMKGAKIDGTTDKGSVSLNYIDIPLLLKFRFPSAKSTVSPHLYVGPQLGFKMSCKFKATAPAALSGNCSDNPFNVETKSTDFSLVTGGGVDVGRALIDVRYDWGVSRVEKSTTGPADDVKNRTLYILVGWTFKPAK